MDAKTQQLFDAGSAFEAQVNEQLAASGALLLSDDDGWDANIEATLAAMRDGAPVIVNGRLPRDGARMGAPDVLVRVGDGYVPVDVKLHGTRKNAVRTSAWVSSLARPATRRQVRGLSESTHGVEGDGFQLAHYTRMLQGMGFHPGEDRLWGGIIGQSDYSDHGGDPWLVVWYDLATPRKVTYSATAESGRVKRSLLERYDHEFGFRLKVAEAARAGEEIVRPFNVAECGWCVWQAYCQQVAGPEDASFAIGTGLPTAQQWRLLYDAGVTTVAELAAQDPGVTPAGWILRDTQAPSLAQGKFRTLVRRARMVRDSVALEPLGEWPEIPSADVEVDFDIEWDFENRIYLWGLRVRQGQSDSTAVFDPVVSYEVLDDAAADRLAAEFAANLGRVVADADAAGRSVTVFHWSDPERSRTSKYAEVAALLEGRSFDLYDWFRRHFLTREGNSIKAVAPIFGFHWAVDDAGGAESQLMIGRARGGGEDAESAKAWLHRYNQSDVAAQAAIRDGLRRARAAAGRAPLRGSAATR